MRLLAIVVGSAVVGLGANAARPDGLALLSGADVPAAVCTSGQQPTTSPLEVAAERARELVGSGTLLLDARSADDFARGHAPGARHQPCASKLGDLPRGGSVIVYDGGELTTAREVADALRARGIDAKVLSGGFAAWGSTGAPAESGACDDCDHAHRSTATTVSTSHAPATP